MNKKRVLIVGITLIFLALVASSTFADWKKKVKKGASNFGTAVGQNEQQKQEGRRFIGKANSEQACHDLAVTNGCSGSYAYYEKLNNCFCN